VIVSVINAFQEDSLHGMLPTALIYYGKYDPKGVSWKTYCYQSEGMFQNYINLAIAEL